MHPKKKTFFLLFMFTVLSVSSFSFESVNGEEVEAALFWDQADVYASSLDFSLTLPTDDPNIYIETKVIGIAERPFETSTVSVNGSEVLYKAKMWFEVQVNILTLYTASSAFDYEVIGTSPPAGYCRAYTSEEPNLPSMNSWHGPYDSIVKYHNWNMGIFAAYGVDSPLTVDCEFNDQTPEYIDFGNEQYSISTKQMYGTIQGMTITDREYGIVAPYDDHYTSDIDSRSLGSANIMESDASIPAGGAQNAVDSFVSGLGMEIVRTTPSTIQQGAQYISTGDIQNNQINCKLQPDVVKYTNEMVLHKNDHLVIDTKNTFLGGQAGIHSYTEPTKHIPYSQIKGWHVDNKYVGFTIEVEADIYAKAEISYSDAGDHDDLGAPEANLEDYYWQNFVWQDSYSFDVDERTWLDKLNPLSPFWNWNPDNPFGIFGNQGDIGGKIIDVLITILIIGVVVLLLYLMAKKWLFNRAMGAVKGGSISVGVR